MSKNRFKKSSNRTKIIVSILFLVAVLFVLIWNKSTLNSLIPVDYPIDPFPMGSCEIPADSPLKK